MQRADGSRARRGFTRLEQAVWIMLTAGSVAYLIFPGSDTGIDLGIPPITPPAPQLIPLAIAMGVGAWWRRTRPEASAAVIVAGFVILKLLRSPELPVDFLLLFAFDAVGAYGRRRTLPAVAVVGAAAVVAPILWWRADLLLVGWERIVIAPATVALVVVAPLGVGWLRRRGDGTAPPLPVVAEQETPEWMQRLTRREREVVALLALGKTNRDIALDLGVTVETVKTHVGRVLTKSGARNRTEAALLAARNGVSGDSTVVSP